MPLIKRSYRDLSAEHRREGAKAVRGRIRGALATPGLTESQIKQLQMELAKIDNWEAGGGTQHSNVDTAAFLESFKQKLTNSG